MEFQYRLGNAYRFLVKPRKCIWNFSVVQMVYMGFYCSLDSAYGILAQSRQVVYAKFQYSPCSTYGMLLYTSQCIRPSSLAQMKHLAVLYLPRRRKMASFLKATLYGVGRQLLHTLLKFLLELKIITLETVVLQHVFIVFGSVF